MGFLPYVKDSKEGGPRTALVSRTLVMSKSNCKTDLSLAVPSAEALLERSLIS